MIEASRTSHEDFFHALKTGDLDFFIDNLLDEQPMGVQLEYGRFEYVLEQWQTQAGVPMELCKEDLMIVYKYIIAPKNLTILKFTAICKNNGIHFKREISDGKRKQLTKVRFKEPEIETQGKVVQLRN
jgi:hypothetical protein